MIGKYLVFSLFSLSCILPNNLIVYDKDKVKKIYGKDLEDETQKEKNLSNSLNRDEAKPIDKDKPKEKKVVSLNNNGVDNLSLPKPESNNKLDILNKNHNLEDKTIINNQFRSSNQSRRFYKDIYSSYSHSYSKDGMSSSYYQTSSFILLKWSDYASSWDEFKKYYGNLNFDYYGKVSAVNNWKIDGYDYSSSSASWSLNSIESGTGWQTILSYSKDVKYGFWYKTKTLKGIVYYKVYKSSNYIKGQFDFTYSGDSNLSHSSQYVNFQAYIKNVKIKNTYNYSHIKNSLNKLTNQNVWIDDDSPNGISSKNEYKFNSRLNQIIRNNLGSKYYDWWKNDFYYDYYYSSKIVYLKVKFNDINTNSEVEWKFKLNLRVNFNQNVKHLLNNKLNNQTISLTYDYPTSISNSQNRSKFNDKITNLLKDSLGYSKYQEWKDYIKSYEYDFNYNKVRVNINFRHPDSGYWVSWSFNIYLKIYFDQWVKSELDKSLNNKTFTINSDYPTNISDSKNKSNFTNQINKFLQDKLRDKYQFWKNYIKDYEYDFYRNKVKIYFKFNDQNSNQSRVWTFEAKLNINLNQFVKIQLEKKLNKTTIEYESDHSTSILESNNLKKSDDLITSKIKSILKDDKYSLWEKYIQKYSYDETTNRAIIVIKFNNPNDNRIVLWKFEINLKVILTKTYWDNYWKKFHENKKESLISRLKITPGKVVNPSNPDGDLIDDEPTILNDKNIYSTTAFLRFDALKENDEKMKINGTEIDVLDYQFTYQLMADNNVNKQFEIELTGIDKKEKNTQYTYKTNYVIKQFIPPLFLKWYAWDPDKTENYKQKELITPFLENNKPNPKYDKEINVNTGTKTQIVWIKKKPPSAFASDPLDGKGNLITNNKFDKGYLVEASVSHKGILESFEDPWIKKIERTSLDLKTFQVANNWIKVDRNKEVYFSESGAYLYRIIDQKDNYGFKAIVIGNNDKDDNYLKFLDLVDNQNLAINFWSTIQGYHLKSFLAKYKHIEELDNLTYEQILGYWKEYVSGIKTRYISLDIHKHNFIDLSSLDIDDLKINDHLLTQIRQKIINHANNQLEKFQLKNNLDYQILGLADRNLLTLLDFDKQKKAKLKITVIAITTSEKARNSLTLSILNSQYYEDKKAFDLSLIKFKRQIHNFSKFTSNELTKWIDDFVNKNLNNFYYEYKNYHFKPKQDYQINLPSDDELDNFIKNKDYELKIQIKSNFESLKVKGTTYLELSNDFNKPEIPKVIDDNDKDDESGNKEDPNEKDKQDDELDKKKNIIVDLNKINFKRQVANFSKFDKEHLKNLLKNEIVSTLKNYYEDYQILTLEVDSDYKIIFPSDDEILKFIQTNGSELKITIEALNNNKVSGTTYLYLLNDFNQSIFEKIVEDKENDKNDFDIIDPNDKDKNTKQPDDNDNLEKNKKIIFNLNDIIFKRQVANFSKFNVKNLIKLLNDEITKTLKRYYQNYQILTLELDKDYAINFPTDDEILRFIKTNQGELKITIRSINKDKLEGETYLNLFNDFIQPDFEQIIDDKDNKIVDKKDPDGEEKKEEDLEINKNNILDLNGINFKRQIANFSKFNKEDLKNLLKDEIAKTLKNYYENYQILTLELDQDYKIIFPSDDDILSFIKTNGGELNIIIQSINKDKAEGQTNLELSNDFKQAIFEKIIDNKDKKDEQILDKKDPDAKDKDVKKWIEEPSSQILISFIVLAIIMTIVIGFILKNRFTKGIGGRRIKRKRQDQNIKIEGVN